MATLDALVSTGRYDRAQLVAADRVKYDADQAATFSTEAGRFTATTLKATFGAGAVRGGSGGTENVITLPAGWTDVGKAYSYQLTDLTYIRDDAHGGKETPKFSALVRTARNIDGVHVAFIGVHMPTRNTDRRRKAWAGCAAGLTTLINALRKAGWHVVVGIDTNAGWKSATERPLLDAIAKATGCHWALDGHAPTTTRRLIDNLLTDLPVSGLQFFSTVASSDHPWTRVTLDLPAPQKVAPTSTKPAALKPPAKPKPTPMPVVPDAQKVIDVARKYVGFHETRSGGHWDNGNPFAREMGWADHKAWCASFACAVFKEAGLLKLIDTPSPGVDQLAVGFKRARRWSEYPAIGAIPFYGTPDDLNHVGACVVAFDADTITTIEGNTNDNGSREGDGVYLKKRMRRSANVVGYGYPRYAQPIVSADPAWQIARQTPPVATTPVPGAPKPTPAQIAWPAGFKPDIDGVDLSHWQAGPIDWAKAKAAGVKFAYHKATEHLGYRDPGYGRRRGECAKAGVLFGAYHFARPAKSGGTAQAKFFLASAKPKKGDLRPMLDLEDRGGLSPAQLQAWVEAFVAEVTRQTGKPPVLYTNFELTRDPGCWLWVARYNNDNRPPVTPKAWTRPVIWQYSNGVLGRPSSVPGIGPCDINTLFPGFVHTRLVL